MTSKERKGNNQENHPKVTRRGYGPRRRGAKHAVRHGRGDDHQSPLIRKRYCKRKKEEKGIVGEKKKKSARKSLHIPKTVVKKDRAWGQGLPTVTNSCAEEKGEGPS